MHIPDGYLSPATCAVGYAVAVPCWYYAIKSVRRMLNTRLVPLISVFSAFCFVIMMFNLPVPGGTTAHAIGIGIATIVLGPWAATLAISIALLIQALFFGDGGITAFGFNTINMGVIGAWVTYFVYHLVAGRAALISPRRVLAAGIAGYVAINAAALAAAIEFGVQPLWFHTADGTPLYAPYPLSIAIPAMMLAHLTIAGLAEGITSAGLVAWLQRSNPDLLRFTARSRVQPDTTGLAGVVEKGGWFSTRWLWLGMAVLMVATPLGLLATAEAWGEWGPDAFASEQGRAVISTQSLGHATPAHTPAGLERLSSVWTSPIPDYAPPFMHSEAFGYILSALVGGGLIILTFFLLAWLVGRRGGPPQSESPPRG